MFCHAYLVYWSTCKIVSALCPFIIGVLVLLFYYVGNLGIKGIKPLPIIFKANIFPCQSLLLYFIL